MGCSGHIGLFGYAPCPYIDFAFFKPAEPLSETLSIDELRNTDTLTPLERLYSFGKSDVAMHRYAQLTISMLIYLLLCQIVKSCCSRVLAVKELSNIISNIETSDLVEYILPLLNALASDSGTTLIHIGQYN